MRSTSLFTNGESGNQALCAVGAIVRVVEPLRVRLTIEPSQRCGHVLTAVGYGGLSGDSATWAGGELSWLNADDAVVNSQELDAQETANLFRAGTSFRAGESISTSSRPGVEDGRLVANVRYVVDDVLHSQRVSFEC